MKTFSHKRPVRDKDGAIINQKPAPVSRVTRDELGGQFGSDKRKRLVVTLCDGDLISFRPERTQRSVTIEAVELYRYAIRCQVNAIERRAKEIKRSNGGKITSARKQARKEII
jgi:hypothetical protein